MSDLHAARTSTRSTLPVMRVAVGRGTGTGPNELSAFDSALLDAGVANFNLVRLSSVIPPATEVVAVDGPIRPSGAWGDRLHVVLADARTSVAGATVAAGIGWAQGSGDGRGLFVEHEASTSAEVATLIDESLDHLARSRGLEVEQRGRMITEATCVGAATCALVVAVFGSAPWPGRESIDLR